MRQRLKLSWVDAWDLVNGYLQGPCQKGTESVHAEEKDFYAPFRDD